MSALLGVFGSRDPITDDQARRILRGMRARGADRLEVWREDDVLLGVGRYEWEMETGFSGPVLIARDERFVVAADASVFYREELLAALEASGIVPGGESAPELVLAAFRAWGRDCATRIDGDFAFVVWDRLLREASCIRDFGGKRPLHYAKLGRELVVASTIGGVAAHPDCPTVLNEAILGATAAGLVMAAGPDTCFCQIQVLPNAHFLRWKGGSMSGPTRYWEAPVGAPPSNLSHLDAAVHLRELLSTATRERMDRNAVNTVWMSGGWDSTSVFAAARHVEDTRGVRDTTRPVSISYPEEDPGREDELIEDVARQWGAEIHWLDIADIPFLEGEEERADRRDEPYAHLYERWNRALAAGSRSCGARIALDGNGGDQLFQNTDVFLADLFRSGRWATLFREWGARERGGAREFFSAAIQPNLSPPLLRLASWLRRGRPLRHYMEGAVPPWMNPEFVDRHRLVDRERESLTRPLPVTHAEREIEWYFSCLFFSRAFAHLGTFALSEGVELRSPLSDRRVIEFALSRPWWERSSGTETKRLLRSSMKGLLPDHVLAPRSHRTGITSGYSHRWMREVFPRILHRILERPLLLEELGIVRSEAFRKAADEYIWIGDAHTRVNLYYTLQTELWLRSWTRREEDGPARSRTTSVGREGNTAAGPLALA